MTDQPPGAGTPGIGSPMSERMQALLSRAVEDQASEQRQTQAVLGEIRTILARLPAEVAAAAAERPVDPGADVIRARLDDLAGRITLLGQRIDALSTANENRAQDDTSLLAVVGAVQSATETLIARLDTLTQRVEDVGARSAAADAAHPTADVVARMSALEGRLAELTTGLAEVHGRLGGVANVIAPLPEDVRGLSERIESRLGARLEQLDEIANAVAALSSRDASAQPSASGLDEIRTALEALSARPSLAEDREGVVLAVRQVLGETVRSTVTEVAAQSEQRILAKVDESTSASDERVLARLVESMSASEERLLGRVDASASTSEARVLERVDQSVAATEQRLIDHVDAAVLALAEALLKRRPGGGRAEPLAPRRAAPTAPAAPAAPVVAEPVEQEPPAGEPPAEEPPDVVDEAPPAFAESDDPGIIEGTVETVSEEVQPPGHDLGADADVDGASDQTRRRRAWWRPGE